MRKIKKNVYIYLSIEDDQKREFHCALFVEIVRNLIIVTSAVVIYYNYKWVIIDVVCSLIIIVFVQVGSLKTSKNCIDILMEATPEKYQIDRIEAYLLKKVHFI